MTGVLPIQVDLGRNVVLLGPRRISLEPAGRPGAYRLQAGCEVRAMSFQERSSAVREAQAAEEPESRLQEILLSTVITGDGGLEALCVALALAGGGESTASFEAVAVQAARLHGWDRETLSHKPAIDVDRAVSGGSGEAPADAGWKRIVFAAAQQDELESLCLEMTRRLLERGLAEEQAAAHPRTEMASVVEGTRRGTPAPNAPDPAARPARNGEMGSKRAAPRFSFDIEQKPELRENGGSSELRVPTPPLRAIFERKDTAPIPENYKDAGKHDETIRARWSLRAEGPAAIQPAGFEQPPSVSHRSAPALAPQTALDAVRKPAAVLPPSGTSRVDFSIPLPQPLQPSPLPDARQEPTERHRMTAGPAPAPPDAFGLHPAALNPRLDWLSEIARALADECDLRGLDA